VLFWWISGAIVLRMMFIVGGLALMQRFYWTISLFRRLPALQGLGMMRKKEEQFEPKKIGRFLVSSASFPVIDRYERNQFFGREDGTLRATPLFVAPYRDRKLRHSFFRRFYPSDFRHHADPSFSIPRTFSQCSACGPCISPFQGSCRCCPSYTTASHRS
jgi:hypothetical protein